MTTPPDMPVLGVCRSLGCFSSRATLAPALLAASAAAAPAAPKPTTTTSYSALLMPSSVGFSASDHRPSAAHRPGRAGDVARQRAEQEGARGRDVLGGAQPPHRDGAGQALGQARVAAQRLGHEVRARRPGAHAGEPDALAGDLPG